MTVSRRCDVPEDKALYFVTASQYLDYYMQQLRAVFDGVEFDEDA